MTEIRARKGFWPLFDHVQKKAFFSEWFPKDEHPLGPSLFRDVKACEYLSSLCCQIDEKTLFIKIIIAHPCLYCVEYCGV